MPLRPRPMSLRSWPIGGLLPSPPVTPLVVIAAGIVAIAIGSLLLRSYGPRVRVGRLLAVTPGVTFAAARDLAGSGTLHYVRVDGRLDADEVFPDEHQRPLVYRRRRIEARLRGGWRVIDEQLESVAFRVREGIDEVGVDAGAIGDGLVTLIRESTGTAGEVTGQLTARLAPDTPVRLRIEQLSTVEHAIVLGVPAPGADGAVLMTRGTGRPLVVCTLEREEAMRVLADRARPRPVGQDAHCLLALQRADDQRSTGPAGHQDGAVGARRGHAQDDRVLHRGELLDPQPDGRVRGEPRRELTGDLAGGPGRFPDQGHEAIADRVGVHADLVDALANAKRDRLPLFVDHPPATPETGLDPPAAVDERALVLVGEDLVGVEAPVHPHVAPCPAPGQVPRGRDRHARRHGEQPPDPHARSVRSKEERADRDRDDPGGDHDEGGHGRGW